MTLQPGLTGVADLHVTEADTARALGSGDVDVLGTPRVVALAEQATVAAVAGAVGPEHTTVGTRVELDHRKPTRVGGRVRATAMLTQVEGGRLTFDVAVIEDGAVVAAGIVHRAVVDRSRFVGE